MFASLSSPSLRTTLRTVHERTAPGPQDRSLLDAGCVDDEVEEHRAVVISHANQHNSPAGRAQSFRQAHRVRDAAAVLAGGPVDFRRSEEHTSELQSLMRISYAVFCLKKKK